MNHKILAIRDNLAYFSRNCLQIKTKDAKLIPLAFNQTQVYFHKECERMLKSHGKVRILVVKGRQSGISTYVAARFYHKTSTRKALGTFILSHESQTTEKLFNMVKLYQDGNPLAPGVKKSNSRELNFDSINSTYYVGTAGSGDVGRGGTIQLFHGSEVAMWKNTDEIQTGLMESIPDMDGTEVILESTAKGMGNYFHKMVIDALADKNGYKVVFLPWHWMDEYEADTSRFTLDENDIEYRDLHLKEYDDETILRKLAWRRNKINTFGNEWKFKQEYPATIQEAFQTSSDSLIRAECIIKARQNNITGVESEYLVIGVDPARTGDRTAIVFRRGRRIEQIITYDEMDEMRLAGILGGFIDKYDPIAVNVDCTNSWGSVDRLKERGYRCVNGIHFASKATENRLYRNKRVEMWCNLRDWIHGDVDIPDSEELHIDLACVPDYKETSDGLIKLESKDKIKEVAGLSPDLGDAAALTFAVPIGHRTRQIQKAAGGGLTTLTRGKRR